MSTGSNWLIRLRSANGFPADQNLSLERFLNLRNSKELSETTTNDPNPISNSSPRQFPGLQSPEIRPGNGEGGCFTAISNVLAELFVMGNTQNLPKKKGIRKQPNPRNYVVLASPDAAGNSQSENVPVQMSRTNERQGVVNGSALDGEDEDTCGTDLSAFSRTEVTVIDTSFETWKFEKMLFRRKNVWKVRDKKFKGVINVGRKKRKGSTLSRDDTYSSEKKSKLCSGNLGSDTLAVNEGPNQNDTVEEVRKEGQDNPTQISKTRLHRKLKKGSSSVILVKNIPIPKKIGKSNAKC